MRVITLNNTPHAVEHVPVSPEAEHLIGDLPLGSVGLSALLFEGTRPAVSATGLTGLAGAAATPGLGQFAGKLTRAEILSIFGSPAVAVPFPPSWPGLRPATPAAGVAQDLVKSLFDALPQGTEVPLACDGIGALVSGTGLWALPAILQKQDEKSLLERIPPAADVLLEGAKTVLDALPPGLELPVAVDVFVALTAALNLYRGRSVKRSHDEKVFFYSSNILDIAALVTDVFPTLHALGRPLSYTAFALKSGPTFHTFSVTPQPGAAGATA